MKRLIAVLAWLRSEKLLVALGSAVVLIAVMQALVATQRRAHADLPEPDSLHEHRLDPLIRRAARQEMPQGWDWRLLKAMVRQESNFDRNAVGPAGAIGLTQLLPSTAESIGLSRLGLRKPASNLQAGARYLHDIYEHYDQVPDEPPTFERTRLAIAGYNAGPGRLRSSVRKAGRADWEAVAPYMPASTRKHVRKVVDQHYQRYADDAGQLEEALMPAVELPIGLSFSLADQLQPLPEAGVPQGPPVGRHF